MLVSKSVASAALLGLALVVAVAGCGGADGTRKMRAEPDANGVIACSSPLYECDTVNVATLDCAAPVHLGSDGRVTDFSCREWNAGAGKWCNAKGGYHGSIFGFKGSAPMDSNAQSVNTDDGSFRLALSVSQGSYAGGGLAFEAGCVDASAFTGIELAMSVASGSIAGCTYQLQLQTFEQRPTSQNPSGGCDMQTTTCYRFPAATNLPALTDQPQVISIPFSSFTTSAPSMTPTPQEIVGLQWQVNSSTGACTVELRIDDIRFIPAAAPPADAGTPDDAATISDASSSS